MANIALCLFVCCTALPAAAGDGGAWYRGEVEELLKAHRSLVQRLDRPAELTGRALLAGGSLYLAGSEGPWIGEGSFRSGGLGGVRPISTIEQARAGDIVWLNFSAETYEAELRRAEAFEAKGCLVIAFGPRLVSGAPRFRHWLDSLTLPGAHRNFLLMANVVSLWTLTAELAAYTARQGSTLVFLQSAGIPGGMARNNRYSSRPFHDGRPAMDAAAPGTLAAAYLAYVETMVRDIAERERRNLGRIASEIARRAEASHPAIVVAISHMMPDVVARDPKWLRATGGGAKEIAAALDPAGYFVWLGYYGGVPQATWDAVRGSGARAAWVAVPKPGQHLEFKRYGDVFANQQWETGDAAVQPAGYDIRILPPSGIAQIFVYEYLLHQAGARSQTDSGVARVPPLPAIRSRYYGNGDAEPLGPEAGAWKRAEPIIVDREWNGYARYPDQSTTVKALWNEHRLYLLFDSRYVALHVKDRPDLSKDRFVFLRDCVEFFAATDPDRLSRYVELDFSPAGEWFDARLDGRADVAWTARSRIKTGVDREAKRWWVSVAIPMDSLSERVETGKRWRVNFYRIEGAPDLGPKRLHMAWSSTLVGENPNFHFPVRFGWMQFVR